MYVSLKEIGVGDGTWWDKTQLGNNTRSSKIFCEERFLYLMIIGDSAQNQQNFLPNKSFFFSAEIR